MENPSASRAIKFRKYLSPVTRPPLLLSMLLLSILVFPASMQAASAVPLGTAVNFGVLGGSTVTNTGATIVNGDLGVSPGLAVTGFPPGSVTGTIYVGVASPAGTAQADALVAYNNAAGQGCNTNLTSIDLGTVSTLSSPLAPGVYCFSSSAQLTGTLYLNFSDPNAVFIFQIGSTLTTASNASVLAVGSPSSCNNIIWQVGSSATLGTGTMFLGDILAKASITVNGTAGASNDGGLYADTGAVTLSGPTAVTACGATGGGLGTCSVGGLSKGFWTNKNGQKLITAADLTALDSLNLVNANGTPFIPTSNTQVKNWLKGANAKNMAYMLSAQLAAMELNVLSGHVSGGASVFAGAAPGGCTIPGLSATGFISVNDLISDASAELVPPGNITRPHDFERACQEFKKNALDAANNNGQNLSCP